MKLKLINYYLIIALACVQGQVLMAINPSSLDSTERAEVASAVKDSRSFIHDFKQNAAPVIQQEHKLATDSYYASIDQREKDQNSLLCQFEIPGFDNLRTGIQERLFKIKPDPNEPTTQFGIYKRNIFEAGEVVANMLANYYLFSQVYRIRTVHILQNVLNNPDDLLSWLVKLQDLKKKDPKAKAPGFFSFLGKKTEYQKAYIAFQKHCDITYKTVQYNPFTRQYLPPLLISLGIMKGAEKIRENYVFPSWNFAKYEKKNGEYILLNPDQAPTPVTPALNYLNFYFRSPLMGILGLPFALLSCTVVAPLSCLVDQLASSDLKDMYRSYAVRSLPILSSAPEKVHKALESKTAETIGSLLLSGYAVKLMDSYYNQIWFNYLIDNMQNVIPILTAYKTISESLKKDPENKTLKAKELRMKKEIYKLVTTGHSIKSLIPGKHFTAWTQIQYSTMWLSLNSIFTYYIVAKGGQLFWETVLKPGFKKGFGRRRV